MSTNRLQFTLVHNRNPSVVPSWVKKYSLFGESKFIKNIITKV